MNVICELPEPVLKTAVEGLYVNPLFSPAPSARGTGIPQ